MNNELLKKEFIGLQVTISYNHDSFTGKIVNETKNLLFLETGKKIRKIIKKNATVFLENQIIEGNKITKRPEDRIKGK